MRTDGLYVNQVMKSWVHSTGQILTSLIHMNGITRDNPLYMYHMIGLDTYIDV